jgi:hypothetical protein
MANLILMRSMNPPARPRPRPWRGDVVSRLHRWRYDLRFRAWANKPLTERWKARAESLSRRLGHNFNYRNRWLILSGERFADSINK